jgi:hypothetical protein
MFDLTTVSAQTGGALTGSHELPDITTLHPTMRPVEAKGPFTDKISRLKQQIADYHAKTFRIRTTIDRLTGAMTLLADRRATFKDFTQELRILEDRLDARFAGIGTAESMVKLFRQTPDDPPARLARPSTAVNVERQKLLQENRRLTEIALGQERVVLVQKMRLRLYHDHRDVCRLRRILNKMEGGGDDYAEDESITEKLKSRTQNLRRAIERERERIARLSGPQARRHEAAAIIQKAWRRYLYRLATRPRAEEPHPVAVAKPESPVEQRPADAPAAAAEPE